jgi:phosphoglycolate phosphatase
MAARFDLLVVDMDGTLVDSEAMLVGLVNETLRLHGYPPAEERAVVVSIGLPLDEVFARTVPAAAPPAIEALCRDYRRRADAAAFVSGFRLFAGVEATLAALRATNVRVAVATSKGRATSIDILVHCRIRELVDEVIGGDCVTRGKPHPEMVHRARALFGTPPDRTLVVGDTTFDIEMGKAAGVATCAVTYGMHPAAALRALRPEFVVDRFESVGELLAE